MSQQHFLADESTAQGARRILLAELDAAAGLLCDSELPPAEAVHEARKKIKRLRALLRLLRPRLGAVFVRENAALRDTAQALTGAREAAATLEALDQLEQEHPGHAPADAFAAARAAFAAHAPRDRAVVAQLLASAAGNLRTIRRRLAECTLPDRDWKLVSRGFRDEYRRARRALREASRHLTAEAFHELRKAVKTHQHQLQLFEPVWPELLEPRRKQLAELSELLGHHHDLALLAPNLRQRGFGDVAAAAEERSAALEQEILREARRLLAERPRHLAGSVGAWFRNYRRLTAADAR